MKKLINTIRKYKNEYDNATNNSRKHWMCDGAAERICQGPYRLLEEGSHILIN